MKKVLTDSGLKFSLVQDIFNMGSGPAYSLPTTEMAVIAFHGNPAAAAQYMNMPQDPLLRHPLSQYLNSCHRFWDLH